MTLSERTSGQQRPRPFTAFASILVTALIFAGLAGVRSADAAASNAATALSPTFLSGSYEGSCATDAQSSFAQWRGVPNTVVLDGLDSGNWAFFENPTWWMDCYRSSLYQKSYSLPLLIDPGDTMQAGAAGNFNGHFQTLARNLVANGESNSILRPGWELNGGWYRWAAYKDPAAFIAYWRQIVTVMRAVPGQHFTFTWTVANNYQVMNGEAAWPGDAYVDQVGVDVYDATWAQNTYPYPANDSAADTAQRRETAWTWYETSDHGLDFWSSFAAAHGKPLSFPEWGLVTRDDGHGGGDNPSFVQHIHDFIVSHNVVSAVYFDYYGDLGDSRLRAPGHEAAAAKFLQLFGPAATPPPTPTPTPTPPTPAPAPPTVTATVTVTASSTVKTVIHTAPTVVQAASATATVTASATVTVPTVSDGAVSGVHGAKAKAKALAKLRAHAIVKALARARAAAKARARSRAKVRAHALAVARARTKAHGLSHVRFV